MTRRASHQPGDQTRIGASPAADQPGEPADLPACGDFDIRIDRDGTWYYRGSPIGRKPLVKLFSTVLHRDDAGDYWLRTPVERGRIEVEDAPFVAVDLTVTGAGVGQVIAFRTNVDDWVELGPDHPLRLARAPDSGEPRPYILVRGRLEALIARSTYYHLVDLAVERRQDDARVLGVWSKGTFFPLGTAD